MIKNKILNEFLSSNAIQEGHFILSSGLHSSKYIQCAQLLKNPIKAEKMVKVLIEKIPFEIKTDVDIVVSPAMGGVILGYEVARQLGCKTVFCERVSGEFVFRRDFAIAKNAKVLIVEDVVTTAKSSLEVVKLVNQHQGNIIAEVALIDRTGGRGQSILPCPLIPLLELDIKTYTEENVPESLAKIPVSTPGSRFIVK